MHTRSPLEEAHRGKGIHARDVGPHHREAQPWAFGGATNLCVAQVPRSLGHPTRRNRRVAKCHTRDKCRVATRVHHANTPADPSWPTTCGGDVAADPEREVVYTVLAQDGSGHADRPPFDVASRLEAAIAPRMPGVKDAAALHIECLADIEDLLRLLVGRRASQCAVANAADFRVGAIGGEALLDLVQPREGCFNRGRRKRPHNGQRCC